jgi:hypothetical protein
MALITPTITDFVDQAAFLAQWLISSSADTCVAIDRIDYPDRTVQMTSTGAFGLTVALQGSNVASSAEAAAGTGTFATLTDPQGNAITSATNLVEQVMELTRWTKPTTTTGTVTAPTLVTLFARRAART